MQGGLIYILPMLINRSMKLLTIYITLCIHLHNIFVRKEKYHVSILWDLCNIIFKLQEYYITSLWAKIFFSPKTNMFYMCSHLSAQMETLLDNLSVKAIIIDLLV